MKKNKKDSKIPLNKEQTAVASAKLREYITENFDVDIGNLQAEIFLDYISENIGVHYYNKGVIDSLSFMEEKVEDMCLLLKDGE